MLVENLPFLLIFIAFLYFPNVPQMPCITYAIWGNQPGLLRGRVEGSYQASLPLDSGLPSYPQAHAGKAGLPQDSFLPSCRSALAGTFTPRHNFGSFWSNMGNIFFLVSSVLHCHYPVPCPPFSQSAFNAGIIWCLLPEPINLAQLGSLPGPQAGFWWAERGRGDHVSFCFLPLSAGQIGISA